MRIWDVDPKILCRSHLLGEHRELHAIWNILNSDKKGYRNHPETKRWVGKLKALYVRHEQLVTEMQSRGYNHNSPLLQTLAIGHGTQEEFVDSIIDQLKILSLKNCECCLVISETKEV